MKSISVAILALAVSGCQAAPDQKSDPALEYSDAKIDPGSTAKPTNKFSRQLFEMQPQVRRATFREFLRQSNERCELVTEAVLKGSARGLDMWRISCTDAGDIIVSIDRDSSTKILDCGTMARLGSDCRKVW